MIRRATEADSGCPRCISVVLLLDEADVSRCFQCYIQHPATTLQKSTEAFPRPRENFTPRQDGLWPFASLTLYASYHTTDL